MRIASSVLLVLLPTPSFALTAHSAPGNSPYRTLTVWAELQSKKRSLRVADHQDEPALRTSTTGTVTMAPCASSRIAYGSGQCNNIDLGSYNLDLHIVALFIVLLSSFFGVTLPLVSSSYMSKAFFGNLFFAAKHFGTGVIISTAFVHLLYHAFVMFGNACLGELAFEPAAAAISMAGTYVVFAVDFFVMRWLKSRGNNRTAAAFLADADGASVPRSATKSNEAFGHSHGPTPNEHTDFSSPQAHFDVWILEAGIIFHSIMIGVSLGASGGDQWKPLFIAVVFHQFFEGLSLGSRIGQLMWPVGSAWKKWVMAGAFTLITPIGVAIGIGVHSSYNPNSGAALLSIGVLDSISAGILIYAGLVEMLYHDSVLGKWA
ncbi:hypothetical protein JCM11641_006204 [Rhodosporidiobolus odoratus]